MLVLVVEYDEIYGIWWWVTHRFVEKNEIYLMICYTDQRKTFQFPLGDALIGFNWSPIDVHHFLEIFGLFKEVFGPNVIEGSILGYTVLKLKFNPLDSGMPPGEDWHTLTSLEFRAMLVK